MSWMRDMLILVLIGFYLVMALASEAATLPFKSTEEWVITVGHSLPERMSVVRGNLKQRKVWLMEYTIGESMAGRKLLLNEYYQKFETELEGFLRLDKATYNKLVSGCAMPVLIHHRDSGKLTRKQLCPAQMSAADQLKFGDWFRRWQLLVTHDQVF